MTETSMTRPRRSLHFVPGGHARMFDKALGLPADSLILDLEDSVTPENKAAARDAVCDWLQADFGGRERLVRINAQDSPWGRDDLEAVIAAKPDGLVLPKVVTRAGVDAIDQIVGSLESQHGLPKDSVCLILIATETPAAVFNVPQMARNGRVSGVSWGAEDLSGAIGARSKRDDAGDYLEVFSFVRSTCLLSAAAAGVQPIDAVYVDIRNTDGLKRECIRAADMGFRGKLTIHPDQIPVVNDCFTPSMAEVEAARELLAAFEEAQAQGRMAFAHKGKMVDVPHLTRARDLLALHAQLESLDRA